MKFFLIVEHKGVIIPSKDEVFESIWRRLSTYAATNDRVPSVEIGETYTRQK